MKSISPKLVLSVVSHGQLILVKKLFDSLNAFCSYTDIEVVLTINIPEEGAPPVNDWKFPLKIIVNDTVKGFGANHNSAFSSTEGDYFCVINPDILLTQDPFPSLISQLHFDDRVGVVAPKVFDSTGKIQDNARLFMTPVRIFQRYLNNEGKLEYLIPKSKDTFSPDWLAGMFLLFPWHVYSELGGFDETFFMYCEDTDICLRMRKKGYQTIWDPSVSIVHSARHSSHKKIKYLLWHLRSMTIFLYRYYTMETIQ